MRLLFFLIFGLIISMVTAQGSVDGFFRGKENLTTVLGFGFEDTKNYFAGTERTDIGRNLFSANTFLSYGILNNLDIQASLPYLISNERNNFQDAQIWTKWRFLTLNTPTETWAFSLAGGFSFNVSDYKLGGLNDLGQQAKIIESRMLVHYQTSKGWFATAQSGFSFKFGITPNSLPVTLKVGRATARLYFDLWYDVQHAFGGIDYLGTPRPQDFRAFGVSYQKVGGTVYFPFSEKYGIYISPAYSLAGRNTFQGPTYHLGWVYHFQRK